MNSSSKQSPKLGVNIDHVATLRRLRDTTYPDLVRAAHEVIAGGADQITVHLREDRRHIVDADVAKLRKLPVDLNFEMAATPEMLAFALQIKPHSICVVPEKREERTTEGGLDLRNPERHAFLKEISLQARRHGIIASFFIEPDEQDVATSLALGAQAVELHTGALCIAAQADQNSPLRASLESRWLRLKAAAVAAQKANLLVHAGHGIDLDIAKEMVARVPEIIEYNIGHFLVCDSVFIGLREATRQMKQALRP